MIINYNKQQISLIIQNPIKNDGFFLVEFIDFFIINCQNQFKLKNYKMKIIEH